MRVSKRIHTRPANGGRRRVLIQLVAVPVLLAGLGRAGGQPGSETNIEALRKGWRALLPEGANPPSPGERLRRSREEWRRILEPMAFEILRDAGTEAAYSSPLNDERRPGVYVCAGCELPVFTSAMKYDSGTGWPSFFTTIPDVFETSIDFVLILPRTEYHCVRCGGHHGHVFDDGPPPTHKRWCNNGAALRFLPQA